MWKEDRFEKLRVRQQDTGTGMGGEEGSALKDQGDWGMAIPQVVRKQGGAGFLADNLNLLLDKLNLSLVGTKVHPWEALQWTGLSVELGREAGAADRNFRNTLRKKNAYPLTQQFSL